MPATTTDHGFPRPMLWAVGALVCFAIIVAALGRWYGITQIPAGGTPVATRNLRFADRPDGGIDVTDADRRLALPVITGQAGFLRGTLRGLASARKRAGLTDALPFRLTAWKDGRLTLDDPANGRHVELEAFGPTNEAAFAALLTAPETPP